MPRDMHALQRAHLRCPDSPQPPRDDWERHSPRGRFGSTENVVPVPSVGAGARPNHRSGCGKDSGDTVVFDSSDGENRQDFTSGATGGGDSEYSGGRWPLKESTSAGEGQFWGGKRHPPALQQGSVLQGSVQQSSVQGSSVQQGSVPSPAASMPTDWPIDHTAFDSGVGSFMHETDAENTGPTMEQLLDPNVPPSVVLMYNGHENDGFRLPSFEEAFMLDSELDYNFMTEDGIEELGDEPPTAGHQ